MRRTLYLLVALAACSNDGPGGGDDGDDTPPQHDAAPIDGDPNAPDAEPPADAEPSSVVEVPCQGATIAVTVTAISGTFQFDGTSGTETTIQVDDIVRFQMPAYHNAVSDDGLFSTQYSQTKCWQFTAAGSFSFRCQPHQFTGTIVVE